MPNTTGIADTFKANILAGVNFTGVGAITSVNVKAALYLASGSLSNTTSSYIGLSEVSGAGYTAGGVGCATNSVGLTGNIAFWQPGAAISYGTVTLSTAFDSVLLYSNGFTSAPNAIAVFNFGSTTVNSGTFSINLPTYNATSALIRLN
jgi:hypothetical protein